MSSKNQTHAVASASLSAHYKEVESFQRQRAKAAQRTSKALVAVAGIAILGNFGQAWTIASLLPLVKIVPVYLWVRGDGTIDNAVTMSRLPGTQAEAVKTAALWEYVRLREGYSFDSAQYGYDAVSGMSAETVRAGYQRWFNYPNPQSPQVTIGRKGTIGVEHISSAYIAPAVQQIRFRRIVDVAGQQPATTTWTATLQFETMDAVPAAQRLRNPGAIIITSYQVSEDSV